jgi:S1-C subfamily serine protease
MLEYFMDTKAQSQASKLVHNHICGYIVTNNRCKDASEIEITLNNKKSYKPLIGTDLDIALKIDATKRYL